MRIVPHDARTKEAVAITYCEINWKDRGKEKEELNIPLVMQKKISYLYITQIDLYNNMP